MHSQDLSRWQHSHAFDPGNRAAERSTRIVMWITAAAMAVEIGAGWWFNSMALLADGWHMSSHALAIGLSSLAYAAARRHAGDPRFAFGTWKIEVLGGFASAVMLLAVAALMVVGSAERLVSPQQIRYGEAIFVAIGGLLVNVVSALVLGHSHSHGHGWDHHHDDARHAHAHEGAPHTDLNLRSAYVHVIADAATSVLAIVALAGGWMLGWGWLDPVMGLVGAVLVATWARNLILETGKVLLDREMDHPVVQEIREAVEAASHPGESKVADLHVWRVGRHAFSCALTVVTHDLSLKADEVRERIQIHEEVVHVTVEIQHCT